MHIMFYRAPGVLQPGLICIQRTSAALQSKRTDSVHRHGLRCQLLTNWHHSTHLAAVSLGLFLHFLTGVNSLHICCCWVFFSPSLLFVFRVNNLNSNYVTALQRKMIINALCLHERLHCAVCRSLKTRNFSPFKADLPTSTQEAFWTVFSVVCISCTYTSASISTGRLRRSHKGSHSFSNSA